MLKTPKFFVIRVGHDALLPLATAFALRAAKRVLPEYSCPNSPQRFTQPQLLACLVIKPWLGRTYRNVAEKLEQSPRLQSVLGLRAVPHYSTLKRFADRIDLDLQMMLSQAGHRAIRLVNWGLPDDGG